jgi:hypothetical protein
MLLVVTVIKATLLVLYLLITWQAAMWEGGVLQEYQYTVCYRCEPNLHSGKVSLELLGVCWAKGASRRCDKQEVFDEALWLGRGRSIRKAKSLVYNFQSKIWKVPDAPVCVCLWTFNLRVVATRNLSRKLPHEKADGINYSQSRKNFGIPKFGKYQDRLGSPSVLASANSGNLAQMGSSLPIFIERKDFRPFTNKILLILNAKSDTGRNSTENLESKFDSGKFFVEFYVRI